MFGFFRKKEKTPLFEGSYWDINKSLKSFKVRAKSINEAIEILKLSSDFKFVCEIKKGE